MRCHHCAMIKTYYQWRYYTRSTLHDSCVVNSELQAVSAKQFPTRYIAVYKINITFCIYRTYTELR